MSKLNEKITLTKLELKIIIEDAFIDGWKKRDNDWYCPEDYLEECEEVGDSCETVEAIKNLLND